MPAIPLAVQLYSLRDLTAKDFASTVRQVAATGYTGVELAGYGNLKSAEDVKRALDDAGLRIVAAHVGLDALETDLHGLLDEQHALNNATVVCPWMPEDRRRDAAGWKRAAQALNQIGGACRERGFEFCYHHHSFEFERFDGRTGMDILLDYTESSLVKIELDTYWLKHGGEDPVAFIDRVGRRAPLVHLKDMSSGPERGFAPVGEGTLDFAAILDAMQRAGARWGIVEQDDCFDTPPLEAIRISFQNLRKLARA